MIQHRFSCWLTISMSLVIVPALVLCSPVAKPVPFIIDTDIGPYPDDVGAFSILHTFADQGLIDIRAIMANNRYEGIVPVIESMNIYFNRSNIQIGVTKDPNAYRNSGNYGWPEYMVSHFSHPMYKSNAEAEDAVQLYRRVLSISEDNSVTILSLGHFINLANLMRTGPDQYSPLTGIQLVAQKVNRLVAMAGIFPRGDEWNLMNDIRSARYVLPQWPTSILFVGFEAGEQILCGQNLLDNHRLEHSPVQKAFQLAYNTDGFLDGCFDEITALVAVKGVPPMYKLAYGTLEIMPNGTDVWHNSKSSTNTAHIQQVVTNEKVLDVINPLLAR